MIDTGDPEDRDALRNAIEKIIALDKVKKVILTHLHYDHSGNAALFPEANIFISAEELDYFRKDAYGAVLNSAAVRELKSIRLRPLPAKIGRLRIIHTQGHTLGAVCIAHESEKVLFTGDTFFGKGMYGRTDLPSSAPEKLAKSLERIRKYKDFTLAPGHDY